MLAFHSIFIIITNLKLVFCADNTHTHMCEYICICVCMYIYVCVYTHYPFITQNKLMIYWKSFNS